MFCQALLLVDIRLAPSMVLPTMWPFENEKTDSIVHITLCGILQWKVIKIWKSFDSCIWILVTFPCHYRNKFNYDRIHIFYLHLPTKKCCINSSNVNSHISFVHCNVTCGSCKYSCTRGAIFVQEECIEYWKNIHLGKGISIDKK